MHSRFPCLSETFVFAQAQSLAQFGLALRHVSNRRPREEEVHPPMRAIQSQVFYLQDATIPQILAAWRWARDHLPMSGRRWLHAWRQWQEPSRSRLAQLIGALLILHRFAGQPIHLHAHFTYGAAAVARWCWLLGGVPYSLTLHGSDVLFDDPPDLKTKVRDASAIVSISHRNLEALQQRFGADVLPARTAVIPLGVVPLPYQPPPPLTEPLKLLNVGRLSEHKAQHVLIDACARLRDRGIAFVCDIVGTGEREALLRERIAAHRLQGQVRLLGARFHEEVLTMYRQYHAFVLTSIVEGMPTVIMEAMNAGVPVVTTDVGAIRELVAEAALIVPANDPAALADALTRLAKGEIDTQTLTRAAHERLLKHFDVRCNHRRFAEFLRTLPVAAPGDHHPNGLKQ